MFLTNILYRDISLVIRKVQVDVRVCKNIVTDWLLEVVLDDAERLVLSPTYDPRS